MWIALIIVGVSIILLCVKKPLIKSSNLFKKFGRDHARSYGKFFNLDQKKIILEGLELVSNRIQYFPQYVKGVYHFDGSLFRKKQNINIIKRKFTTHFKSRIYHG